MKAIAYSICFTGSAVASAMFRSDEASVLYGAIALVLLGLVIWQKN